MTPERALEIIAAYGADSSRWPVDERAALVAMAADHEVAAAMAQARTMDAMLGDWAQQAVSADLDFAAMTAVPQEARAPVRKQPWPSRWIAGGAIAAAVAGLMVMLGPVRAPPRAATPMVAAVSTVSPVPSATAKGSATVTDSEAFASVFTPTVDEEELI